MILHACDTANYLDLHLKPVFFHGHLYTVLESGRRANLSIIKFTQERGAASSFLKVTETLEAVLGQRGFLIEDETRRMGVERSMKDSGL